MKIFLIGYMGSGKSTVGKKLAKKLNMDFIDSDTYIEKEYKQSINTIFDKEGEKKFREMEHNSLKAFVNMDNVVVSTGGGVPCFYDNMELMNNSGITVYLKMSVDSLVNRLANAKTKRPLIKDMSEKDLRSFVEAKLEKRDVFYSQAQYKVKAKDIDVDALVNFIREKSKA